MGTNTETESDVSRELSWLYESTIQKAMASLIKNGIPTEYARDSKEALEKVINAIPPDATIGIGDSVSLHQIGFYKWLDAQNRVVFNAFERHPDGRLIYDFKNPERFKVMRQALTADVYMTGSNAVTLDGKLVNIDGRGNRVASMIFGPGKVIVVAGANKIVKDEEEALKRIRTMAAPANAKRHSMKHHMEMLEKLPCVLTGICAQCKSEHRICRKITIIDGQSPYTLYPGQYGLHVILVGESLGL